MTDSPDNRPENPAAADFVNIPRGLAWKCQQCGDCCGNVFSKHWVDPGLRKHIGEAVNDRCVKWDAATGRCSDYANRSNVCRGYPFTFRKIGDRYYPQVHTRCRGVGLGDEIVVEDIVRLLVDLCRREFGIEYTIDWTHLGDGYVELRKVDNLTSVGMNRQAPIAG